MKCDELKYERLGDANKTYPASTLVIRKQFVDSAIEELKDENRRLKRALWLARAERARDNSILLPSKFMRNVWDNVERKCIKKAEQYK